ncbi:MAG: hypothetical protein B0W54_06940 [Cellvibrio sp. 79]|nr:MAG: hypothetical protein B0W54_06940 [Cellvibrio sp. 79]
MNFLTQGFELIENIILPNDMDDIHQEIDQLQEPDSAGIRHADTKLSTLQQLAKSSLVLQLVEYYMQDNPQLMRCILFNKTAEQNWLVSWHQDKTLCMPRKFEHPDWGPWSIKDGLDHTQPPLHILNKMVTLRFHLDDNHRENGCLKVLPESHRQGILSTLQIQSLSETIAPTYCLAPKGSVLAMKPLLVHASSKATKPDRRRVVHMEFVPTQLISAYL